MKLQETLRRYQRSLALLMVLSVGTGIGFGVTGSDSLLIGLVRGLAVGGSAFLVLAPVFLTVVLGSWKHLRLLQGVFLGLIVLGIVGNLISGRTVTDAIGFGIVSGSLAFIPFVMLFALLFLAYLVGKHQSQPSTSG
ncbi:hypothetical protein [Halobacteriaceae bacterium SHR40]|uniref:hypothetical protein n=1 Tax=Halovenus amylolytica TaxID=2500550 RepID=UPI000FE3A872